MSPDDLIRAAEDDPNRCKAATARGQCQFMALRNPTTGRYVENCKIHQGGKQIAKEQKADGDMYKAAVWQQRMLEFEQHPKSKTLTAELSVLRVLLEQKLQRFTDPVEIMMAAGSIGDLVMKIQALVKTINNFDKANGQMLDIKQVEELANEFINIIVSHVKDTEAIELIVDDMGKAIKRASERQVSGNNSSRSKSEDRY